jgi:hypothetical protein
MQGLWAHWLWQLPALFNPRKGIWLVACHLTPYKIWTILRISESIMSFKRLFQLNLPLQQSAFLWGEELI